MLRSPASSRSNFWSEVAIRATRSIDWVVRSFFDGGGSPPGHHTLLFVVTGEVFVLSGSRITVGDFPLPILVGSGPLVTLNDPEPPSFE